jgi:predicted nucleic acid-binding protein
MIYLLDVNVLLALGYEEHVHQTRAWRWLDCLHASEPSVNLATCSITELGFVRIASGGAGFAPSVSAAQEDLNGLKRKRRFAFLSDGLGADRLPCWVERSKQVTDGHLLELALAHNAVLVTLDNGIPGALLVPDDLVPLPTVRPSVRETPGAYGIAA